MRLVNLFVPILLVLASATVLPTYAQSKDAEYQALLSKLKGGDVTIDFKALRMAFADSKTFSTSVVDPKMRTKLIESVRAKKFDDVAKEAQEILKSDFLDMFAHIYASTAYQVLRDSKKAEFHKAVYVGLINSIVNGADGDSTKTAYVVLSVDEENAVLNAFELQKLGQNEIEEGGRKYVVVTATEKATNSTSKIYFNVDLTKKR